MKTPPTVPYGCGGQGLGVKIIILSNARQMKRGLYFPISVVAGEYRSGSDQGVELGEEARHGQSKNIGAAAIQVRDDLGRVLKSVARGLVERIHLSEQSLDFMGTKCF